MNFGQHLLNQIVEKKSDTPSQLDFIHYIFFDKGISLKEFEDLPIPYILSMVKTQMHLKEKELEEIEKAKKKRR